MALILPSRPGDGKFSGGFFHERRSWLRSRPMSDILPGMPRPAFLLRCAVALFLSGFCSLAMEFLWLGALNPSFGRGNEVIATCLALGLLGWSLGFLSARPEAGAPPPRRRSRFIHIAAAFVFVTPFGAGCARAGRWGPESFLPGILLAAGPLFLFNWAQGLSAAASFDGFQKNRRFPEERLAAPYAAQLAGALLGALLLPFWVLPALGVQAGSRILALLSLLAAALARPDLLTATEKGPSTPSLKNTPPFPAGPFFLAGAAGSMAQGAWLRLSATTLGTTTAVSALVVALPLLGSAVGGMAVAAAPPDRDRAPRTAVLAALLAGGGLLTGLPLINRAPFFLIHFLSWPFPSMGQELAVKTVLVGAVSLMPAILAGVFYGAGLARAPESAGRILGWSALGNAAGLLSSLLIFIPRWGSEKTLMFAAVGYAAAGAWTAFPIKRAGIGAAAVLGLLGAAAAPPILDPYLLSSGTFLYGFLHETEKTVEAFSARLRKNRLLFYREGPTAAVSVLETPGGVKALRLNGKTDASSGFDMGAQRLLAELPLRFAAPARRAALVVGFGSGVTAGTLAAAENMKRVDAVEIEPAVLEAARWFKTENAGALDNPVLHPVIQDARRWMARQTRRYDLITSEPSNLWTAGSAALFTREFFTDLSRALNPGGVVCQWVHGYGIREVDLRSVMATFASVFPETRLYVLGDDFFLLGSDRPFLPETGAPRPLREVVSGLLAVTEIRGASFQPLLALDNDPWRAFAAGAPIQTDDRLFLEWAGLRSSHLNEMDRLRERLRSVVDSSSPSFPPQDIH